MLLLLLLTSPYGNRRYESGRLRGLRRGRRGGCSNNNSNDNNSNR